MLVDFGVIPYLDFFSNPPSGAVASDAPNSFPGFPSSVTQQGPRTAYAQFGPDWNGGPVTIVGLDAKGNLREETLVTPDVVAGGYAYGVVAWSKVISITKTTVGVGADSCSVFVNARIGLPKPTFGPVLLFVDGSVEECTFYPNEGTVDMDISLSPDGARSYMVFANDLG